MGKCGKPHVKGLNKMEFQRLNAEWLVVNAVKNATPLNVMTFFQIYGKATDELDEDQAELKSSTCNTQRTREGAGEHGNATAVIFHCEASP